MDDLTWLSAVELTREIAARRLSSRELVAASIKQIQRFNPQVNAIISEDFEAAEQAAAQADEVQVSGAKLGMLHGLPVAHKDMFLTKGMRTTYGSPIYKDFIPDVDSEVVARQRRAGAITLGKTNVPEFAAGSHTFNALFGATRNPYNLDLSAGGSSGGAASALASGMLSLADGSDMGGSLRNPASFCNVVGLRPSFGTIPMLPTNDLWGSLSVAGPMARTVEDTALFMSVLAGGSPADPITRSGDGMDFLAPLEGDVGGVRVAWGGSLGLPVESSVMDVVRSTLPVFESLGCVIEEQTPNLEGADDAFKVLRAYAFEARFGMLLDNSRDQLKKSFIWNLEQGRALSGPQVGAASAQRSVIFQRMRQFFDRYDFLVLPVSQVLPFPVKQEYPASIDGTAMRTYIDWMKSCYYISLTGHPCISVPAGFTPDGIPVGVQIVGKYRQDFALLKFAYAFEQATKHHEKRPPLVTQ